MALPRYLCNILLALLLPLGAALPSLTTRNDVIRDKIAPKVIIISMWQPEAEVWYRRFPEDSLGNLTHHSIWTPGLSPLYPRIYCNPSYAVCQATTGMAEINAATSLTALLLSPKFDFSKTYFLFAGIAGVNPKHATLGSVALAKYVVQVALQYEIDSKTAPGGWSGGYFAYGNDGPLQYPTITYGTEVFELSGPLREIAYRMALGADLSDSESPAAYRSKYADMGEEYAAASQEPGVLKCDTATSDVYYSGKVLAEAFENVTEVWTNGTGVLCMTAQEDNANLEVMTRFAVEETVDFSRIMVMRSGSNFDRPPPGMSDWKHLTHSEQNGFHIAIDNLFDAGMAIVHGILNGWDCFFEQGIPANNYIGDIFGSLGGTPDYGLGSRTDGKRVESGGDNRAALSQVLGKTDDVDLGEWDNPSRPSDADPDGHTVDEHSHVESRQIHEDWPPGLMPSREC